MLGYLKGKVIAIDRQRLLIDHNGLGYWVSVPGSLMTSVTEGAESILFLHTHVREDALQLFGFSTLEDLRLFEKLLTVSGIGPKLALNVFNAGSTKAISQAITAGDVTFFTAVSGVGKKSAQRLIVDLAGKLSSPELVEDSQLSSALARFGFSKNEIEAAVKKIDPELSLEEQLKAALKNLGN